MRKVFIDMDGTLAEFREVDTLETLYEQNYFKNLKPVQQMIDMTRKLCERDDVEVYVLSSCLTDSKYALKEKNEWLDTFLPEVPAERRLFPPCGTSKLKWLQDHGHEIDTSCVLIDDYSKNLHEWDPPGTGLKVLNGINHTKGTWQGKKFDVDKAADLDVIKLIDDHERQTINATDYICTLDADYQTNLQNVLSGCVSGELLQEAMSGRLVDIEDLLKENGIINMHTAANQLPAAVQTYLNAMEHCIDEIKSLNENYSLVEMKLHDSDVSDNYLFNVLVCNEKTNEHITWLWNDSLKSLNQGHYGLDKDSGYVDLNDRISVSEAEQPVFSLNKSNTFNRTISVPDLDENKDK